jgi:predicted anti-sigma-YlaC factor YlaD
MEVGRLLPGVMCDQVREAISARLDDEEGPLSLAVVDSHLADCAACRAWTLDVERLQRRARVVVAPVMTDETERFLAAVRADAGVRANARRRLLPVQLGLVAVAVGQLLVSVPSLLLGHDRLAPEHVAHELGAFTVALAAGFALAAFRPRLANGMVPIVGIVAGLLVLTAWLDASFNNTSITAEWPHLLEVAGFVLLLRLAYLSNDGDWTPLLLPLRRAGTPSSRSGPSLSNRSAFLSPVAPTAVVSERRRAVGE